VPEAGPSALELAFEAEKEAEEEEEEEEGFFEEDTPEMPMDVSLEESMWAIVLLIGTEPMGQFASAILSVLAVMNIGMQARRGSHSYPHPHPRRHHAVTMPATPLSRRYQMGHAVITPSSRRHHAVIRPLPCRCRAVAVAGPFRLSARHDQPDEADLR
jgi:hypothetical protein